MADRPRLEHVLDEPERAMYVEAFRLSHGSQPLIAGQERTLLLPRERERQKVIDAVWPMSSVVYRGRKLLRHPRLSLLRRTVRHAPGPARNPGADAIPAQFESSLPEMVREELSEWNLTSIRHLDDEAVMTIRVNTVFTVAQKHFCLNAPRPDPGPGA